jgi:hypothetical protein
VSLSITEEVARTVAEKLLLYRDARFRADSRKLTEAIHLGFGAALSVVEPDGVDQFLKKSATLMENIFRSARKELRRVDQPEKECQWKSRSMNTQQKIMTYRQRMSDVQLKEIRFIFGDEFAKNTATSLPLVRDSKTETPAPTITSWRGLNTWRALDWGRHARS